MYELIISKVLPEALMMGVDYDLFWTLTPKSLTPFIKAFNLKREIADQDAWQHGVYIQMAIASVMDSKAEYPREPYSTKKAKKLKPEDKVAKLKEIMMERMAIVNSNLEREKVK